MGYPSVIYNPQRPEAGFTLQDFEGRYLTPTGDYIYWDELRTYILSGFPSLPSAANVKAAQAALGISETGELDSDTMAGVVNAQLAAGITPTGVPDSQTLAAIAQMLHSGQGVPAAPKKKKKGDDTMTLVLLVAVVMFVFRGGD
jgi:hypothetical protein